LSCYRKSRLADPFGKLADGAHDPVLQLFQKQNRELPYASCVGASRVKYKLICGRYTTDPLFLETLKPIKQLAYAPAANLSGASGQMVTETLLQPNGPVV